ncbi:MAG: polyamine aminopropyltransferase [Candidatus Aenigmarchaeota archaeon]|nr:polyamine aminopropyltransferase [Candidatus Aenigmarchaeota archaeon]
MEESIIPKGFIGEQYTDDVALIFKVKEVLVSKKTKFQKIDIIKNDTYGRILFLDDLLMKTDKDGHIINEMIVHVPMMTGRKKKKVLVVGAGEGFTATELLKYPYIEKIDVVDIDKEFVDISKKIYPEKTKAFDDEKVTLTIMDGLEFIKGCKETYDVIFVTPTDPANISSPLFTDEFYRLCFDRLADDGIFMTDAYMPFYKFGDVDHVYMQKMISRFYKICKLYLCCVPSFPGGLFSFVIGSKKSDPEEDVNDFDFPIKTKYYNKGFHKAAFKLPQFMAESLEK